jgi:hypothetical protein
VRKRNTGIIEKERERERERWKQRVASKCPRDWEWAK